MGQYSVNDFYSNQFYSQNESQPHFLYSILFHSLLVVFAFTVSAPLVEKVQDTLIVIELDPEPIQPEIKIPPPALKNNQLESSIVKSLPTQRAQKNGVVKPTAPLAQKAQQNSISLPLAARSTSTQSSLAQKGVPETIDDIALPEVDFDGVDVNQVSQLEASQLDQVFNKIDRQNNAVIAKEKAKLNQLSQEAQNNPVLTNQNVDREIETENARLNDAFLRNQKRKELEAATLAREKQDQQTSALSGSGSLNRNNLAENTSGRADGSQNGQGTKGLSQPQQAANLNRVRALGELKQRPNNPQPQYSVQERFDQQQGKVVFQAFVTPDGTLTQFRQIGSTGYENLDSKTLAALKRWRFFPGQQGWVEIPYSWSLKGEAEPMPTLLRRSKY